MIKEKFWNPHASSCSRCPELKPIKDKAGNVDFEKKKCEIFGWEIHNDLAAKQAVCKITREKRRRLRKR
jgi:hypothetical protein